MERNPQAPEHLPHFSESWWLGFFFKAKSICQCKIHLIQLRESYSITLKYCILILMHKLCRSICIANRYFRSFAVQGNAIDCIDCAGYCRTVPFHGWTVGEQSPVEGTIEKKLPKSVSSLWLLVCHAMKLKSSFDSRELSILVKMCKCDKSQTSLH